MPGIDYLKKAALSIYFLNEKDQRWILSRLPEQDRERIGAFLYELKKISLPRDEATRKNILSYLDIPLDDDLYALLVEMIHHHSGVLIEFFEKEALWVSGFVLQEYMTLFDSGFLSRISRSRINDMKNIGSRAADKLTSRARRSVLRSVHKNLSALISTGDTGHMRFEDHMVAYGEALS